MARAGQALAIAPWLVTGSLGIQSTSSRSWVLGLRCIVWMRQRSILSPGLWVMRPGLWQTQHGLGQMRPSLWQMSPGLWQFRIGFSRIRFSLWQSRDGLWQMRPGLLQVRPGFRAMRIGLLQMRLGFDMACGRYAMACVWQMRPGCADANWRVAKRLVANSTRPLANATRLVVATNKLWQMRPGTYLDVPCGGCYLACGRYDLSGL